MTKDYEAIFGLAALVVSFVLLGVTAVMIVI